MIDPLLTLTRDSRLAVHATAAVGAWLWTSDATRVLWANAAGAALLGAATPAALLERRFGSDQPLAAQIARLAGSLPTTGAPRLDRLRGLGGGIGGVLMCSCSRITLAEGGHGILVVATETVKPTLPVAERAQRLLAETREPVAAFAADGALLHAAEPLREVAGPLASFDMDASATQALTAGHAEGRSRLGAVALHRLGAGSATVLLAVFAAPLARASEPSAPAQAPAEPEPDPAAANEPAAAVAPADEPAAIASEALSADTPAGEVDTTAADAPAEAPSPLADKVLPVETPTDADATTTNDSPAAEAAADEPGAITSESLAAVTPDAPDATVEPADITADAPADLSDATEPGDITIAPEMPEEAVAQSDAAAVATPEQPADPASDPVSTETVYEAPRESIRPVIQAIERRSPLRFVWQIDADGRFTLATNEFAEVMGPRTQAAVGGTWLEIAAALALDPDQRIARAIASRDTWSGIAVDWPVDGSDERAHVELSGLPAFDRARNFLGYRGFGVCRDIARFADLITARHAAAEEVLETPAEAPAEPEQADSAQPAAAPPEPPVIEPVPPEDKAETRPLLTVVPPVQNVVPFRTASPVPRPTLTAVEHTAFKQIAEALGARTTEDAEAPLQPEPPASAEPPRAEDAEAPAREESAGGDLAPDALAPEDPAPEEADAWSVVTEPAASAEAPAVPERRVRPVPSAFAPIAADAATADADVDARPILERMPVGVLVHRDAQLLYANRAFLEWTGYADLKDVIAAGGLDRLVADGSGALDKVNGTGKTFALATRGGEAVTVEGRMCTVPWGGAMALMLVLVRTAAEDRLKTVDLARADAERESRELRAILDTATDGIIVLDRGGHVLSINRSAEALFGYDYHEIVRKPFTLLFAPESERAARDYLDGLTRNGVASVLNDGREVIGRVQQGGLIPLFMTMGRVGDSAEKFCAVFRDITQWKRAEEDLLNAKREAERASSAKSDFLAKISHEIRTPLNAIIGFSEVMMEERFGNVGNDRYRQYLGDIHTSGQHLVSLINDLLDLSKIEAGKLDLVFASVNLNELVQQCVALMQPQANRERIIIRTSLSPTLPPVVIDARSVRQIVLNLLSNSIKFTGAGGQVIVSTALTERGEAVLRVRDTGVGMSEKEIETAMEPFRQLSTSTRWGSGGTGLGLPLTKALAEANRASFAIKSATNAGTLVEITFPATRVLAE